MRAGFIAGIQGPSAISYFLLSKTLKFDNKVETGEG